MGLPQVELETDNLGLKAQSQLRWEIPYNQDVNSGDMIGFSKHALLMLPQIAAEACGTTNIC